MFPYVCLATMPLFCRNDWPRKFEQLVKQPPTIGSTKRLAVCKRNCWDFKDNDKPDGYRERKKLTFSGSCDCGNGGGDGLKVKKRQKFVVFTLILYVALQFFLPYSHFVTKVFF